MRVLQLLLLISLVLQLGHPNYGVREKATFAWIVVVAEISSHPVVLWGEKNSDPEIAARCKAILKPGRDAAAAKYLASLKPAGWIKYPWIDALPDDYPQRWDIISGFLDQARFGKKFTSGWPWHDYREATALFLKWRIGEGDCEPKIRKLLEVMGQREMEWRTGNGYPSWGWFN